MNLIKKDLEKNNFSMNKGTYAYLLDIPVRNLSEEKIDELEEKLNKLNDELCSLKKKSGADLWKEDLDSLKTTDFYS